MRQWDLGMGEAWRTVWWESLGEQQRWCGIRSSIKWDVSMSSVVVVDCNDFLAVNRSWRNYSKPHIPNSDSLCHLRYSPLAKAGDQYILSEAARSSLRGNNKVNHWVIYGACWRWIDTFPEKNVFVHTSERLSWYCPWGESQIGICIIPSTEGLSLFQGCPWMSQGPCTFFFCIWVVFTSFICLNKFCMRTLFNEYS